jgi:hypothetical protein
MNGEVCVFRNMDGLRVAIVPAKVEAITELDDGCQIVTGSDVFRVRGSWAEVAGAVWPELFK